MGSQNSKNTDIRLKNQNIQDWLKAEDQGHCQLWINKRTGRHFKAYTIPQTVINDPQQLQKYTFRKTHANYLVTVEGVLGQDQSFFCSEPRSSFVLVENITSRLNNHARSLTFQQALYVLFVCVNGYNTLSSFFGPLEPHEDMICINDEGQVKIWLNENLARNQPSPTAKGSQSQSLMRQGEDLNAFKKRRTKQCISKLFWIVEKTLLQGYPLDFREQINKISNYSQALNFIEYFQELHNIRMATKIPILTKILSVSKPIQKIPVPIKTQVVYPVNQVQRVGNLEISRVNNVIYRSSQVRDSSEGLTRSRSDVLLDYRTQNSNVPKITFQIRPIQFQNNAQIGLTPANSPVPAALNGQNYNFPFPNTVQNYILKNGPFVGHELSKLQAQSIQSAKQTAEQNLKANQLTKKVSEDDKIKMNLEEDLFDQAATVPKTHEIRQNELTQSSKGVSLQEDSLESNRQNINQTQFTFSKQIRREPLTRTQAEQYMAQFHQYSQRQQYSNNPSSPTSLLHGSQQFQSFQQADRDQNYYAISSSQRSQPNNQTYYVTHKYNASRSPILEQDQNFPNPPNDKAEQIQQWQAQLNKFTQSSKKPAKPVEYLASPIPESENQSSRDPQSNKRIVDHPEVTRQEYSHQIAHLDKNDLQKYIRMKYQNYISQPTITSQKTNKFYEQPLKYQPSSKQEYTSTYDRSYLHQQQPLYKTYQQTQELPTYEYQSYNYEKDLIGKQNYQPNKFTSTYDAAYAPSLAYNTGYQAEHLYKSSDKTQYAIYSQGIHPQQESQQYPSWKQIDRNRKKSNGTDNIDQKYNKYVLNSQKVKPPHSGRGINSWDISQILPTEQSKVTRQDLKPIIQTFERAQVRQKTSYFGQPQEQNGQPNKTNITYDKLRTLLWEQ